jgi:hypothetical protein
MFVGVQSMPSAGKESIGWWGKVELNPSRVEDPRGVSLAPAGAARSAAQRAWGMLGDLMAPSCELGEGRVKRLDVARDFTGVANPAATIRGLAPIHRPWAKRNLVHADPTRHGAQTLMVGTGTAGSARLYDKHAETQGRAPEGTVRWEAECRTWAKDYGGIKHMSQLTNDNVIQLATDRFNWSAMGAEVAATSRVVELVRASHLTLREQASFLGWLMMQAHGGEYQPGKKALAKWRKVQRDLGIAIGDLGDASEPSGFVSRLDWDTGREVYRAA